MYCENPKFKGEHWCVGDEKTVTHNGFVDDETQPHGLRKVKVEYQELVGWWEHPNGADGGDLTLWLNDDDQWEVNDFDGAYDLPESIKEDLRKQNIIVDF